MCDRLMHDVAWAEAHALMELIGHNFREEEQRDLFTEFYNARRAALEAYVAQADRQEHRLRPSNN